MKKRPLLLIFLCVFATASLVTYSYVSAQNSSVQQENEKNLSIQDFITLATKNDTAFEEILIDALKLNYRKDLNLPARDLVLSVKGQYDFFLSQDREDPAVSVSLSKLFPFTGTEVETSYGLTPSASSDSRTSEFNLLISQPIAQNAFGAATRLQDKIIGVEIDVIRYQIIEAYEDYLATLINTYYNWYSAYENLKISESSYEQNEKLLENMNKRAESKIALPVDVNKVKLLVIGKQENVIELEEVYKNSLNLIYKAIRYEGGDELIPQDPSGFHLFDIDFENDYQKFNQGSRTYEILNLLEKKSTLEVSKNADGLLVSTKLLFGYQVEGDEWPIKNEDNMVYAGISVEWPFPDQVERAQYETAKIEQDKRRLTNQNTYLELYTTLKNIHLQIQREKALIKLADEKIGLAEAVLKDESRNYSFGKITLNDYIDAVNKVDTNKFNKILHTVQLKKLLLEWLRLTDSLVDRSILKSSSR
ncbi:MAG: TolC family protein [Candidatus Omnitrophota bacterium]